MGELVGLIVLLLAGLAAAIALAVGMVVRDLVRPPRHTAGYAVARGLATDPGELGLAFESWTHEIDGDVRLAVWEIALRDAPGTTTVFVHDWGASRIDALAAIEPWRATSRRLVLYDQRGHGESTGTSRLGRREASDLVSLLGALGDGPFRIVGAGLGVEIANAAAAAAAHVDEVVAASPARGRDDVVDARLRRTGTRPLAPLVRLALTLRGG